LAKYITQPIIAEAKSRAKKANRVLQIQKDAL